MKKIPFPFVLDLLFPVEPVLKPMFGCTALYLGEKILLIMRDRPDHTEANGIWVATSSEHHESLRREIASLSSIDILSEGKGETSWQMISSYIDSFEEDVQKVCEMIRRKDVRIGRIPKKKAKKKR